MKVPGRGRVRRSTRWFLGALLLGVAVGVAARVSDVRPVKVVTGSMSPTIAPGDWIVVKGLDRPGARAIHRGDIVQFRYPPGGNGRAIKRVVACGGDLVAITERSVTVNGRVIPVTGAPTSEAAREREVTVPVDHVFLLGDDAVGSIDSRSFGAVPTSELVGRELFVIGSPPLRWLIALGVILCGGLLVGVLGRSPFPTPARR